MLFIYIFKGCLILTLILQAIAYDLKPLRVGVEIRGIDLKEDIPDSVIASIKRDVKDHSILVFKDQETISAERQVEISQWFGSLDCVYNKKPCSAYPHPKSEHPDVFRISNDPAEGFTGVGRKGWHIDGSFQPYPCSHAIYHMVHVPRNGAATEFVSLSEIVKGLSPEKRARWDNLWMVSDGGMGTIHPVIYSHPDTQEEVLCFHVGMIDGYIWDYGKTGGRFTNKTEMDEINQDIREEFEKLDGSLLYIHKWSEGDFIISDNLAVGHQASASSQASPEEIGLRVLHRTTVGGTSPPRKHTNQPETKDEL